MDAVEDNDFYRLLISLLVGVFVSGHVCVSLLIFLTLRSFRSYLNLINVTANMELPEEESGKPRDFKPNGILGCPEWVSPVLVFFVLLNYAFLITQNNRVKGSDCS